MSENHQASLLADWLATGPTSAAPEELDPQVVEAVYALRPDFAPRFTVTIDDIVDTISTGPFLDPAIGEALHAWINSPPGTRPPDVLPAGVVEATYALRPELAPKPGIGIDDILDAVQEGPLSQHDVVMLNKSRPWWTSPAIGVMAIAAMAVVFVRPMANKAQQEPHPPLPASISSSAQAVDIQQEERAVQLDSTPIGEEAGPPPMAAQKRASQPPPSRPEAPAPGRPETPPMESASNLTPPPPPTALAEAEQTPTPARSIKKPSAPTSRSTQRAVEGRPAPLPSVAASTAESSPTNADTDEEGAARHLRLNPQLKSLESLAQQAIELNQPDKALEAIESALQISNLHRFDTARLWRTKARILTMLGRETDAQDARQTAARIDPTR